MNITEILVPPQAIAWLPWAVQYFFYIGSAYAAAIMFLIALAIENHTSHRLRAALALTMAIGAIVGPLALTGDLHQPGVPGISTPTLPLGHGCRWERYYFHCLPDWPLSPPGYICDRI